MSCRILVVYACDINYLLCILVHICIVVEYLLTKSNPLIFRSCFTDVEELLGKPVQAELSAETGVDVALDALVDLGNGKNYNKNI